MTKEEITPAQYGVNGESAKIILRHFFSSANVRGDSTKKYLVPKRVLMALREISREEFVSMIDLELDRRNK